MEKSILSNQVSNSLTVRGIVCCLAQLMMKSFSKYYKDHADLSDQCPLPTSGLFEIGLFTRKLHK